MDHHTSSTKLRFAVLGPLRVWRDGAELNIGPMQQRVVLAVLLLHANQPVSREKLIDAVWGTTAPGRAVNLLQRHAAGLRRVLEPGRPARAPSRLLSWTEAGYMLTVPAGRLDLEMFTAQVAAGRAARAAGDLPAAAEALHGALELWRGRLCEGLAGPLLEAERDRLAEHRLDVLEERLETDLALGRHAEVVTELAGVVREHPLRERLRAQQMLALYRSGRQAEALAAYRQARALLVDQLGIEPGPELQSLEQAVLTADPALAPLAPEGAPSGHSRSARVPCLLPGDVAGFTGRERQMAWLDRLTVADQASTTAVIGLVSGTPGVGKTALAVHWAHRVRPAFPDGQLYVNLRGYDPEQPMTAGEALARLLTALGLRGQDIPLDVDDRAARYRSELVGRRMLVVLDNAAAAEQLRPLLPGTATCATLVTSRDALPGLVALHGAHRLVLDLLPVDDAQALLRRLIGSRVEAEPQATATLAELCRRLPLALRLAAELAAARPHHSLTALATELADRQRRLDLLAADEEVGAGVRTVFSWSYQRLPADAARAFRMLALHPGPDWNAHATAALTHTSLDTARRLLDQLARAHLIQPTGPDRYTMHDLLHAYAAELTITTDPEGDRHIALTRLFDHYLTTATTATTSLGHHRIDQRPRLFHLTPVSPAPPVDAPDTARTWLDAERANLVAVCAHAARHGWHHHALDLAATLFRHLDIGGHYTVALTIHSHACDAARHTGDHSGEAYALIFLGLVYWRQGHFQQATDHHRRALNLARQTGYRDGQAHALAFLGLVYWRQGEFQQAAGHERQAADLFRRTGNRDGQAHALIFLGLVYWQQGHYQQAVDYHRQATDLFQETENRDGEAYALTFLGLVYWQQGLYQKAADHHRRSLDLSVLLGNRAGQAYALVHLGMVYWRQGHHQEAADYYSRGLHLFSDLGNRDGQVHVLACLGLVHWRQGHYQEAADHHRRSLDLARQTGNRVGQANGLTFLGLVYCQQGHHQEAADHHRRALDLSRQTGYRPCEVEALNGLGEALQANGQAAQARTWHTEALNLASQTGDRYEQARAHAGIATTHHTAGDIPQARRHWQDALGLYADLGVPDADTVCAQLAALAPQEANPAAPS
ncbi:XRE family transcriptional regulator [Streptomyces ruber]|uniref:XRE family transcriptional regulator n=2 Tax=Streptomyces TaxID=1883 RepID=A0A918BQF5_9ACTN|nr:tetratricopeptide repeat protein [Streptomyces ruber]GGQ83663.1 XRE family transcriptional regulator [Streptomyces ruber]